MTTNEDRDRVRLAAEDAAGGPPSVEQVDTLIDLVDALEARLADSLEARQPGGIDRDVAIDAIAGGTISVPGGYGVLHGDDAANIVDAIIGQAAVPDAATESAAKYIRVQAKANARWRRLANKTIRDAEAERDAALEAIDRIRQAVSGHPECDRYEEGDVISCGWKSAYASVVAALDGAPEPDKGCGTCFTCIERVISAKPFPHNLEYPFIVCAECGNKRCPKAENHVNACTGSNEPGQPGAMRYGGLPVEGENDEA